MQREKVSSSNIASVGFDPDTKTLEIEFVQSGDVWEYDGVSAQKHRALMDAPSVGKYFNSEIRGNYSGRKVS